MYAWHMRGVDYKREFYQDLLETPSISFDLSGTGALS